LVPITGDHKTVEARTVEYAEAVGPKLCHERNLSGAEAQGLSECDAAVRVV
jgi:hypothetical protein